MDINVIPSFLNTHVFNSPSKNLKIVIIFFIVMAIVALVHGTINEGMINPSSIIIVVVTCAATYVYFKSRFSDKIKQMEKTVHKYKSPTVLDAVCQNNYSNIGCQKYREAKRNFYKISNIILEKANI